VGRTLILSQVRVALPLVVLAALGLSIGVAATWSDDPKPRGQRASRDSVTPAAGMPAADAPPKPTGEQKKAQSLVIHGRVLDPDGKPVGGAQMLLALPVAGPGLFRAPERLATSGADGRFQVTIAAAKLGGGNQMLSPVLAAFVPGLGPDWVP